MRIYQAGPVLNAGDTVVGNRKQTKIPAFLKEETINKINKKYIVC